MITVGKGRTVAVPSTKDIVFGRTSTSQTIILNKDVSNKAVGSVLLQMVNDKGKVVVYYSEAFAPLQRKYCVMRR